AGLCPRFEPVGRGGLEPPEECGDAQSGLLGHRRVAPRVPPCFESLATETSFGPILLRPSRIDDCRNLTSFAQLVSVHGWRLEHMASSAPARSKASGAGRC